MAGITFNLFEVALWALPLWMEVRFLALFFAYGNILSALFLHFSGAGSPERFANVPDLPENPFAVPAYLRAYLESPTARDSLPYSDLTLTAVLLGTVIFFGWLRIRTTAEISTIQGRPGPLRETTDLEVQVLNRLTSQSVRLRFDPSVLDIRSIRLVARNEICYGLGVLKAFLEGKPLPLFAFEHEIHHGRCWDSLARTVTLFGQRMVVFAIIPLMVSPFLLASIAFDLGLSWSALMLLLVCGVLAVFVKAVVSRRSARTVANHYREYLADAFAHLVTGLRPIDVRADGNEFHPSRSDRLAAIDHGTPVTLSGDALIAVLAVLSLHQALGDLASCLVVFFAVVFVLIWPLFCLSYRSLLLFALSSAGEMTFRLLLGTCTVSLWFGKVVPLISIPEVAALLAVSAAVWRSEKGGVAV